MTQTHLSRKDIYWKAPGGSESWLETGDYGWGTSTGIPLAWLPWSVLQLIPAQLLSAQDSVSRQGASDWSGLGHLPTGGTEAPPDYAWCRRDHSNKGNKVAVREEKGIQSSQNPTNSPSTQQHWSHGSVAVTAHSVLAAGSEWERAGWRPGGNLQQLGGC